MARPKHNSRESARRKAQKGLETLGYIPRIAKILSELTIVLVECSDFRRNQVLGEFAKIAGQKLTWTPPPRRFP